MEVVSARHTSDRRSLDPQRAGRTAGWGSPLSRTRRPLDGVSHKVLTDTLRRAERDSLLVRHLDPGRVDTATLYQLTEPGRTLEEPLIALERRANANWPEIEEARRRWNRRNDM